MTENPIIGTLSEKSLHAALKQWYAQTGDQFEQRVGRYVVDIVRDDLLIEIQTRNFHAIRTKLKRLLEKHAVLLVYPIARERWILRLEKDLETRVSRRKSPRHGSVYDVFFELTRLGDIVAHPNFSLDVLLIQDEIIRVNDGQGSWRRKGWSNHDHRLIEVVERVVFRDMGDFQALLPSDLPQPFTNKNLATCINRPYRTAQSMTRCLRNIGAIHIVDKQGNTHLYALRSADSG